MFDELVSGLNDVCVDVFKTSKTLKLKRGEVLTDIEGIFDSNYLSVDPETNAQVISENPIIGVKKSEFGQRTELDRIMIDGANYKIVDDQPDSHGMTKLFLQFVRSRDV